jgi:ribonuclease HII
VAPRKKYLFSKNFYERRLWQNGGLVCGLDEVGRGCLAGPVLAAACVLYPNSKNELLRDSKDLTKKEREAVYAWLLNNSWSSVCAVSNFDIDKFNIWHSTLKAMRQSVLNLFSQLKELPSIILIDAMPLSMDNTVYSEIEVQHFIEGEKYSDSIAAASIIAKVTRDRWMMTYDKIFPSYVFSKHKGYATKLHQESLANFGYSIIHRLNFLKNFESILPKNEKQRSIFCRNSREFTSAVDSSELELG